jgi:hypothetical protein
VTYSETFLVCSLALLVLSMTGLAIEDWLKWRKYQPQRLKASRRNK